jgi:hypothetical protein
VAPINRWRPHTSTWTDDVEAMVRPLVATRLLQNPLGMTAAPGDRGDIVRVSDGRASVYLLPHEYDAADERKLRWLLAKASVPVS